MEFFILQLVDFLTSIVAGFYSARNITIILTVFVGICRLLNQLSNMIFMLAAFLILLIGFATILLTHDLSNGLILIAIAFIISPFGLPLIVTFLIEVLGLFKDMIKAI